jgi:hypothetical protein
VGRFAATNDFVAFSEFLERTEPPRPIHMFVEVCDGDLDSYRIREWKLSVSRLEDAPAIYIASRSYLKTVAK